MNIAHPSRRHFLVTALGVAGVASSGAEEPKPEIPSYNRISDEDEIKLGREAAQGIEKEKKLRFIEKASIREYVSGVFFRLTKSSRRADIPYSVRIIDTAEINAFALPGGFVYVNRGLLQWTRSESELAGALGHEIGHVVGRHGANTVARATAAESLVNEASRILLGTDMAGKLLMQVGGPLALLAMLKYTRMQELEADLLGYYNMQRAGWHPQGMIALFRHLGENSAPGDALTGLLSSHPASSEREEQVTAEMTRFPPRESFAGNDDAFRAMQAELKKLPAPKVEERLSQ